MMILGMFFLSLGLFLFMLTNYLSRDNIIILGVIARFMNGVGQSSFVTSFLAYIPILFPDDIGTYMSIGELVGSFGFMIG
jgi:MFS family permease